MTKTQLFFLTILTTTLLLITTVTSTAIPWSAPPFEATTTQVDPNNRVLFLKNEKFVSYAFPFSFNDEPTQVPYLNSNGVLVTINYNFTTEVKSEAAAAVYLCQTQQALVGQGLWQRPDLFERHCTNSGFFLSKSSQEEQKHKFSNLKFASGSNFGVVVVRFPRLTMQGFFNIYGKRVRNGLGGGNKKQELFLQKFVSLENGQNGDFFGDELSKFRQNDQILIISQVLEQLNIELRRLDNRKTEIEHRYTDNNDILHNNDEHLEISQLVSLLEQKKEQISSFFEQHFLISFDKNGFIALYTRNTLQNTERYELIDGNMVAVNVEYTTDDKFSLLFNIEENYDNHNDQNFNLENTPQNPQHFRFTEVNEFEFSLTMSGTKCSDNFFGPNCLDTPIKLKSNRLFSQNNPNNFHSSISDLNDLDLHSPSPNDDDLIIPPGGFIIFYVNPLSPASNTLLHSTLMQLNSTEPLHAFSNSGILPDFFNATFVSQSIAQNSSYPVMIPDQIPGIIWELSILQQSPLFRYQDSHLESEFGQYTWWVVVTNPGVRPAVLFTQKYIQFVCSLDSNSHQMHGNDNPKDVTNLDSLWIGGSWGGNAISKPYNVGPSKNPQKRNQKHLLYLSNSPQCGFLIDTHSYDSTIHNILMNSNSSVEQEQINDKNQSNNQSNNQQHIGENVQEDEELLSVVLTPTNPDTFSGPIFSFNFQPYTSNSPLRSQWQLNFAEGVSTGPKGTQKDTRNDELEKNQDKTNEKKFSSVSISLFLRKGALPRIPVMGSLGQYDILLANYPELSQYTSYTSPIPFIHRNSLQLDQNNHNNQKDKNLQLSPYKNKSDDDFDLDQDIWYGSYVVSIPTGLDLSLWYKETCPNQCSNDDISFHSLSLQPSGQLSTPHPYSADSTQSNTRGECITAVTQNQPYMYYNSCVCRENYYGLDCSTYIEPKPIPKPWWQKWLSAIIVASVLSLLLFIFILYKLRSYCCRCCHCCRCGKQTTDHERLSNERTKLIRSGLYPLLHQEGSFDESSSYQNSLHNSSQNLSASHLFPKGGYIAPSDHPGFFASTGHGFNQTGTPRRGNSRQISFSGSNNHLSFSQPVLAFAPHSTTLHGSSPQMFSPEQVPTALPGNSTIITPFVNPQHNGLAGGQEKGLLTPGIDGKGFISVNQFEENDPDGLNTPHAQLALQQQQILFLQQQLALQQQQLAYQTHTLRSFQRNDPSLAAQINTPRGGIISVPQNNSLTGHNVQFSASMGTGNNVVVGPGEMGSGRNNNHVDKPGYMISSPALSAAQSSHYTPSISSTTLTQSSASGLKITTKTHKGKIKTAVKEKNNPYNNVPNFSTNQFVENINFGNNFAPNHSFSGSSKQGYSSSPSSNSSIRSKTPQLTPQQHPITPTINKILPLSNSNSKSQKDSHNFQNNLPPPQIPNENPQISQLPAQMSQNLKLPNNNSLQDNIPETSLHLTPTLHTLNATPALINLQQNQQQLVGTHYNLSFDLSPNPSMTSPTPVAKPGPLLYNLIANGAQNGANRWNVEDFSPNNGQNEKLFGDNEGRGDELIDGNTGNVVVIGQNNTINGNEVSSGNNSKNVSNNSKHTSNNSKNSQNNQQNNGFDDAFGDNLLDLGGSNDPNVNMSGF